MPMYEVNFHFGMHYLIRCYMNNKHATYLLATPFATCHVTLFGCRMGETWVTSLVNWPSKMNISNPMNTTHMYNNNKKGDPWAKLFIGSRGILDANTSAAHPANMIPNTVVIPKTTNWQKPLGMSRFGNPALAEPEALLLLASLDVTLRYKMPSIFGL